MSLLWNPALNLKNSSDTEDILAYFTLSTENTKAHNEHDWSISVSIAWGKRQRTWWERSREECQEGKQTECHATKSHHITEMSSQIYAHFASEHQPRRQKICKRELLISTDRKTLEKVILRLRCLGAKIFVVNMTHEFQAMSTIQEIIELIILQVSPT